eukprot:11185902-Lingulodinium_polyedra.AAC.1
MQYYYDIDKAHPFGPGLIFKGEHHRAYVAPGELTQLMVAPDTPQHVRERVVEFRDIMVVCMT